MRAAPDSVRDGGRATPGADDARRASDGRRLRVAIVGTGPTALYTMQALLAARAPLAIALFEERAVAGPGIPFDARGNGPAMLANIAGVELPPLTEGLNAWASRQPGGRLAGWGVAAAQAGDERAFFPRGVLGYYFADQLAAMLAAVPARHRVDLRLATRVTDVIARGDGVALAWDGPDGADTGDFDHIVLATGYSAPRRHTPLPAAGAPGDRAAGRRIGILGSSLSAIDAVVAIALRRGQFSEAGGVLTYRPHHRWHATMLSRAGLLPEADFWFPHPLPPLAVFTDAALATIVQGREGDLDRAFALFRAQLAVSDPAYAATIADTDADSFAARHFATRVAADPFAWAAANLAAAEASHARRRAEGWRVAILAMHSVFGRIVPRLAPRDLARFEAGLKRVFVDNYAAVPPLSIRRLLALARARVLSVRRLGETYALTHDAGTGQWQAGGARFEAMIDARGQQPLGLDDLPFPTLRLQLCAQAQARGAAVRDGIAPTAGHALIPGDAALGRVHCLSLPFLLKRNPFAQGLVESAAMARATAAAIIAADAAPDRAPVASLHAALATLAATAPVFCGDGGVIELPKPATHEGG